MEHTPTPWYANGKIIFGATPDDGQIGGCHDESDAEFVCCACNEHDALKQHIAELEAKLTVAEVALANAQEQSILVGSTTKHSGL